MQYGIITGAVFQRRSNNMSGDGPLPGNERDKKARRKRFTKPLQRRENG